MVAESRSVSRGKARSRSPNPPKKTSARSKSPPPVKRANGAGKAQPRKQPQAAGTGSSAAPGIWLVPVALVLVAGVMIAFQKDMVPTNISTLLPRGSGSGSGVEFMGFSGRKVDAFLSSVTMILVNEIGDKTFFIAAVLAMKNSRTLVLGGALGALALMTALSCGIGKVVQIFLPHQYTHYFAVFLFVVFGVKLLKDALDMDSEGPSDELEEVEQELTKTDKKKDPDVEGGDKRKRGASLAQTALWQAFTLTFVAEWGDRSQVSTIALAAHKDAFAVTAGCVLGHAFCTSLAVLGGRMLASRISERTVTMAGGMLFLIFAVHGMLQDPSSSHND